jgi:AraC-like DNA-binding protein
MEPGQSPRLVRVDATGLHLAVEGLCREAGAAADPATLEFWAALVHRQAMRMLQPGAGESSLGQLWSAAHRDLGGVWDLKRMAGCAGMSQESLRRLCLRQVGRPPLSHLTRLRMNTAADILCHTAEKIASVAARVGYGDPFAFSSAFKREMGISPKRFRAAHRMASAAT